MITDTGPIDKPYNPGKYFGKNVIRDIWPYLNNAGGTAEYTSQSWVSYTGPWEGAESAGYAGLIMHWTNIWSVGGDSEIVSVHTWAGPEII